MAPSKSPSPTELRRKKPRRRLRLLVDIEPGNILPIDNNQSSSPTKSRGDSSTTGSDRSSVTPPSTARPRRYSTREATDGPHIALYDAKYHPMDEVVRPRNARTHRARSAYASAEPIWSTQIGDSATGVDESDSEATTEEECGSEQEPNSQESGSVFGTTASDQEVARSTRVSMRSQTRYGLRGRRGRPKPLYNAGKHPMDEQLDEWIAEQHGHVNRQRKARKIRHKGPSSRRPSKKSVATKAPNLHTFDSDSGASGQLTMDGPHSIRSQPRSHHKRRHSQDSSVASDENDRRPVRKRRPSTVVINDSSSSDGSLGSNSANVDRTEPGEDQQHDQSSDDESYFSEAMRIIDKALGSGGERPPASWPAPAQVTIEDRDGMSVSQDADIMDTQILQDLDSEPACGDTEVHESFMSVMPLVRRAESSESNLVDANEGITEPIGPAPIAPGTSGSYHDMYEPKPLRPVQHPNVLRRGVPSQRVPEKDRGQASSDRQWKIQPFEGDALGSGTSMVKIGTILDTSRSRSVKKVIHAANEASAKALSYPLRRPLQTLASSSSTNAILPRREDSCSFSGSNYSSKAERIALNSCQPSFTFKPRNPFPTPRYFQEVQPVSQLLQRQTAPATPMSQAVNPTHYVNPRVLQLNPRPTLLPPSSILDALDFNLSQSLAATD